jgi:hypothetical protein
VSVGDPSDTVSGFVQLPGAHGQAAPSRSASYPDPAWQCLEASISIGSKVADSALLALDDHPVPQPDPVVDVGVWHTSVPVLGDVRLQKSEPVVLSGRPERGETGGTSVGPFWDRSWRNR